ncbi:response regulator [Ulvibacter litoralis]|uniref:Response regulator receiver domain-containing protein n=1 Tax=Ulvibacter litoralis TaxID=227084 RepID=A0A1G7HP02_9FLAO|nr:response regulator [Ulvibacter litoralis]GHC58530.1 response regulator [Ulvibacter litoralis]SDF02177.1 Response regulator receiver domain-containing protein [Ulvibacter litoralis]
MKQSVNCVLLVDDDKATNFFNKMVVNRHGGFSHVVSTQSGLEALEYLKEVNNAKKVKPDLIFLDINMPAMNGWEFLIEFEKFDNAFTDTIKVILLSTSSDPADVKKSIDKHPVDDYINKPLSFPLLNEVLANHFANKVEIGC